MRASSAGAGQSAADSVAVTRRSLSDTEQRYVDVDLTVARTIDLTVVRDLDSAAR